MIDHIVLPLPQSEPRVAFDTILKLLQGQQCIADSDDPIDQWCVRGGCPAESFFNRVQNRFASFVDVAFEQVLECQRMNDHFAGLFLFASFGSGACDKSGAVHEGHQTIVDAAGRS